MASRRPATPSSLILKLTMGGMVEGLAGKSGVKLVRFSSGLEMRENRDPSQNLS
jgi:hypothetical protein